MKQVVVLCLLAACTEKNPNYCDTGADCLATGRTCDVPSHTCVGGSGGAGGSAGAGGAGGMPQMCTKDSQCNTPTPRCVSGFCVQCVGPSDCSGGQICDTGTQMCRACTDDATCDVGGYPGGACNAGGCVPASMVAFANCFSQAGCPGTGSRAVPFCNGQDAIDSGRPIVVMQPNFCYFGSLTMMDKHLALWARGSAIRPADNMDGLHITGDNTNVDVHDLGVNGQGTMGLSGIFVTMGATARIYRANVHDLPNPFASGIRADQAAAITVDSSLVYNNKGWGIYLHSTPSYTITSSFMLANGSTMMVTGGTGGVRFDTGSGGMTNIFAYNTVAKNVNQLGIANGVECDVATTLTDSLIPDNGISATNCTSDHSVLPAAPARDLTQIFVDVTRPQDSLTKCRGFHINPNGAQASAVIGQGAAIASVSTDVDGEMRATPPTVGADEPLPCQ